MRVVTHGAFCICAALLSVRANTLVGGDQEVPVDVSEFKSLSDVHGHLVESGVKKMIQSRARRSRAAKAYSPQKATHRSAEQCDFPIDLHILQDASGSFAQDFRKAAEVIVPKLAPLLQYHPGSTVSLSMFRDKPFLKLGDPSDYCLKPLAIRTQNLATISKLYDDELSSGGYDWTENQFGAIIEVVQSPTNIPWMTNPDSTKLIVLITDAPPHFKGDGGDASYPELSVWEGFDETKSEEMCKNHYYPGPDQVAAALMGAGVQLGTIILRPEEYEARAYAAWEWFNGYIGQSAGYLGVETDDPETNWVDRLLEVVQNLREDECGGTVPPIPEVPEVCEVPEDEGCDECLTNVGCCDKLAMPEVLIAHHDPPQDIDWTISLPNSTTSV